MSLVVSGLAAYTEEKKAEMITRSVLKSRLIEQYTNPIIGIKSAEKITDLAADAQFQTGGTCGWTALGSTTLTQRTVTVAKIKIQEAICPEDLEAKWTQAQVQAGSELDTFDFMNLYTDQKMKRTQEAIENLAFQGDTSSGTPNLAFIDGYLEIIKDDAFASVVNGNPSAITVATGITSANVISIVDGIYELIPQEILDRDDTIIYVGWDVYRTYTIALKTANMFHYSHNEAGEGVLIIPGTNIKLVAFNGLNGTDQLFASYKENVISGHDLLNEYEDWSMRYSEDAEEIRYSNKFKIGFQFAFLQFVVGFKLIP